MLAQCPALPPIAVPALIASYMQDQRGKAGIAERLIKEQSFREAARQAFQQADQTQTSDLLQRCKALNACIRQARKRSKRPEASCCRYMCVPDSNFDGHRDLSGSRRSKRIVQQTAISAAVAAVQIANCQTVTPKSRSLLWQQAQRQIRKPALHTLRCCDAPPLFSMLLLPQFSAASGSTLQSGASRVVCSAADHFWRQRQRVCTIACIVQ